MRRRVSPLAGAEGYADAHSLRSAELAPVNGVNYNGPKVK